MRLARWPHRSRSPSQRRHCPQIATRCDCPGSDLAVPPQDEPDVAARGANTSWNRRRGPICGSHWSGIRRWQQRRSWIARRVLGTLSENDPSLSVRFDLLDLAPFEGARVVAVIQPVR
jgi:hypothetical protein